MDYLSAEKIYKAFANKRRLLIIKFLYKNPKSSVGDIAEEINLSFKSTSRHLQVLKNVDVVESEQISSEQFYYLINKSHPFLKQVLSLDTFSRMGK